MMAGELASSGLGKRKTNMPREQGDGEDDVHGRAGRGDDEALPAGLGQERPRVVQVAVFGLLAGHFDVAAEQDEREAEVRFALAETEQARSEAETERFHLYIEKARCPVVAQFVDQDHDPDENQQPPETLEHNSKYHIVLVLLTLAPAIPGLPPRG